VIRLVKRSFGKPQVIQGNPHGFNSIPTKQIQIRNFGHKKRNWVSLADITLLGLGGKSSNDWQWMLICLMVTPLSLLKFRLTQLCPDVSRNEISTGSSVQLQGKRFPADVDRHLKILDLKIVTRCCFDHFQDIHPFDTLSLRTHFLLTHSLQVSGYFAEIALGILELA